MKARSFESVLLTLVIFTAGCGQRFAPGDVIRVKMVALGELAEREVTVKPDDQGAEVTLRERREPQDFTKKDAKPTETKTAKRLSAEQYDALWQSLPARSWELRNAEPEGHAHGLAIFTIELAQGDRKTRAVVKGPQLIPDKTPMDLITTVFQAAGVPVEK